MDFKNLNTFIQVAESGSFTRAAEILGYSQPTISIQIKQLEESLGIKLFDRIGHTVRLTEKGRDALDYAQRICQLCREMETDGENKKDICGSIRLGMSDSLCTVLLNRGFSSFREQYPGISLTIEAAGTDELFRLLDHNEVDIVCTMDSHIYDTDYVVVDEEKIGVHFIVPSGHELASRSALTIGDLISHPVLATEKGMSYRRLLEERLARDSIALQPVLEIGNADLICSLVEQGIGISFLPDYVTERAAVEGGIKRLDLEGFEPDLWKQLLYHRDKWLSPQMKAVIQHFAGISIE